MVKTNKLYKIVFFLFTYLFTNIFTNMSDQPSNNQSTMLTLCVVYDERNCGGGCEEAFSNITHSVDGGICTCEYDSENEFHDTRDVERHQYVFVSKNKRFGVSCCRAVGYMENYEITVYNTKEEAELAKEKEDAKWAAINKTTTDIKEYIYESVVYSFSDLEKMETF